MPQTKWVNKDGLVVRFGAKDDREENAVPAQAVTAGTLQEIVYNIPDATLLATTATLANGNFSERGVFIPSGAVVESAIFYVEVAFTTGTSAALNLGTFRVDASTDGNGADKDGFDAAIAVTAIDAVGDRVVGDGAQIGARLAITAPAGEGGNTGAYIAATTSTGTFTAGKGRLVVAYRVPSSV